MERLPHPRLWICIAGCIACVQPSETTAPERALDTAAATTEPADLDSADELRDCVQPAFPACDSDREALYATAVADHLDVCLGSVLGCSTDATVPLELIADLMPAGVTATTGYHEERLVYRTTRSDGRPAVATAMLFRPEHPVAGHPMVVVPHGTVGLADSCAPSRNAGGNLSLILPYVATGHMVLSVDYAGLGTEGVQGYGDRRDAARSTLDGVRALRERVLALGLRVPEVVVAGYSQGGATAMVTRDLAESYLPELPLSAQLSLAGGRRGAVDLPLDATLPDWPLDADDGTRRALVAMRLYADHAELLGEGQARSIFAEEVREPIADAVETLCILPLIEQLSTPTADYLPPTHMDELVDPARLQALLSCIAGEDGCTGSAADWHQRLTHPPPEPSPTGGRLLYVSGSEDEVHTPADRACTLGELEAAGVTVDGCLEAELTHYDLVHFTVARTLSWTHGEAWTCGERTPEADCSAD